MVPTKGDFTRLEGVCPLLRHMYQAKRPDSRTRKPLERAVRGVRPPGPPLLPSLCSGVPAARNGLLWAPTGGVGAAMQDMDLYSRWRQVVSGRAAALAGDRRCRHAPGSIDTAVSREGR